MRRGLRWPLAGAVGLMIAVSLLVIPAMGQGSVMGEVGVLRLHLSDEDRFVYDPSTGLDLTQTLTQPNCRLGSIGDSLVSLVGAGSYPTKKPFAGLKDHRIGVGQNYEGTGEPCARINKDLGQVLTLSLTGSLADKSLSYAEIDLGFKYNGSAELELRNDGQLVRKVPVPCTGGSDCGPDSGKSDNERVILWSDPNDDPADDPLPHHWQAFQIPGVFDTIIIKPISSSHKSKSAAISLEGGYSGAAPGPLGASLGTSDTVFKVVEPFDGEIPCEGLPVPLGGDGDASFVITRGLDTNGVCKGPVLGLLYNFEAGDLEDGRKFVHFVTEPEEGALAQFIETITWTFEGPPVVPEQFFTLFYDDQVQIGDEPEERVMPWCEGDPRPLSSTSPEAMPDDHTSCLIESTSGFELVGLAWKFVSVDKVYNIGDGMRLK